MIAATSCSASAPWSRVRGCGPRAVCTPCKLDDREVNVAAFPIGIDFHSFARRAAAPAVCRAGPAVREELAGRQIVLGIDRLDYTKGIPHRLEAFRRLLAAAPGPAWAHQPHPGGGPQPPGHAQVRATQGGDRPAGGGDQRSVHPLGLGARALHLSRVWGRRSCSPTIGLRTSRSSPRSRTA